MGKGEDSIETSSSSFMVEMNQVAHILSMGEYYKDMYMYCKLVLYN